MRILAALACVILCAHVTVAQDEEAGSSPSDFPYHSFLCDDVEMQEFIAEQEVCYQEQEKQFSTENLLKSRLAASSSSEDSLSYLTEEDSESEEEEESQSEETAERSESSGSDEEESAEEGEEVPQELIDTYEWHCQELQAKISCITENSHKCYNSTQVDEIVFNYLGDHFYAFYQEASDGTRRLLPLCRALQAHEQQVVQVLTGRTKDEQPCPFDRLAGLFQQSSKCYEDAYELMLNPSDFFSFFPNSKELRRVKRCRGMSKMLGECQNVFRPCYAQRLMEEVRKSTEEELGGVEELVLDMSGETFKFDQECQQDEAEIVE